MSAWRADAVARHVSCRFRSLWSEVPEGGVGRQLVMVGLEVVGPSRRKLQHPAVEDTADLGECLHRRPGARFSSGRSIRHSLGSIVDDLGSRADCCRAQPSCIASKTAGAGSRCLTLRAPPWSSRSAALSGPAASAFGAARVLLFSSAVSVVCLAAMPCVPAIRRLGRAPHSVGEATGPAG